MDRKSRSWWIAAMLLALGPVVACEPSAEAVSDSSRESVVLLHGLGRSERGMRPLEESLAEAGYDVHNVDYPSMQATPEEIVAYLSGEVDVCCTGSSRLHFVTHSLGGIIARAYLAEHEPPNLGRVVMLAPPNQGSEFVDLLTEWGAEDDILGPTGGDLGTEPDSLPNRLPPPYFELGVIAGTSSINPVAPFVVGGINDGTVSEQSTKLQGMQDFATVDATHTFIMRSEEVATLVISFLKNGRFRGADPTGGS